MDGLCESEHQRYIRSRAVDMGWLLIWLAGVFGDSHDVAHQAVGATTTAVGSETNEDAQRPQAGLWSLTVRINDFDDGALRPVGNAARDVQILEEHHLRSDGERQNSLRRGFFS